MKKPTAAPELVAEVDAQPVENIDAFHVAIDRWLEIEITTTKPLTVTVASVKGFFTAKALTSPVSISTPS